MQRFKDKFALITGGTSGMGFATAQQFIQEGGRVLITGRTAEGVQRAVDQLGANAWGVASQAGSMQALLQLPEQVKQHTQSLDLLFANAGFGKFSPLEQVEEAHFDELFDVLVKGSFFTVQQLLPLMRQGSSIVLNTSVVTEFGFPNFSVYSAAKAAVQSFIKTFAAECTARNIRVNGISPGYINTQGFNKTGLSAEQIKTVVESIIPTLPFRRFGEPEEIAKAVLFLASADASYIHGAEVVVDGGFSKLKV